MSPVKTPRKTLPHPTYPTLLILSTQTNHIKLMSVPQSDEYCPHCDNHFVIEAVTPKPSLHVEGEDARKDARYAPSSFFLPLPKTRLAPCSHR